MKAAILVGGSGFIGRFLVRDLIASGEFDRVYNLDIREPVQPVAGERFVQADVRIPLTFNVSDLDPAESWVFNLAAACREPGFEPHEYFDINVKGAENVTAWAEKAGIRNIYFTSTMSSYGRMLHPTTETSMQYPETPYGVSKTIAERIHQVWLARGPDRRLIICRPGVIFGPGDKENIPRMIKAVRKGQFVFPGDPTIVKGYGYVYGLVDSIRFVRGRPGRFIVYNYAEKECVPLRGLVDSIVKALGKGDRGRIIRIPMWALVSAAHLIQILASLRGKPSAIHPVRVRKVAFPTNLKPKYLIDEGFDFKYPLDNAFAHWKTAAPHEWE